MDYRAVLFDVGCVVIRSPFEMAPLLEHRRELPAGSLGLWGPFAPDRDLLWRELLAGAIDEDEYWARQGKRLAGILDLPGDDLAVELIGELFVGEEADLVRPEVVPALDALEQAGLRTAVLSNHLTLFHRPDVIAGTLRRFDPVIDLSHAEVRKPDPRAFLLAVERLGEPDPSAVVHVDDQPAHVAGAEEAGLRGFSFDMTRPAASFEELLRMVGT